ncbi:unannotated protein [freshwater metagenome]|uniref:Unannotated protein n=1 Tax=freshwater metagenome TaxID=449393 RepID=A0A6J7KD51_9ZZZZ
MLVAFVDECKSGNFSLGITLVHVRDLKLVRSELRKLRKPGQNRLHFSKESDSRRKEILSTMRILPVQVFVIESALKHERDAREACLTELVKVSRSLNIHRIVLEEDQSLVRRDNSVIRSQLRVLGESHKLDYFHESPNFEPCLWISDAIAWANQKGGYWRVLAGLA